jgi:hypothetical protein
MESPVAALFRSARDDLGIAIIAPFRLRVRDAEIVAEVLVQDFGYPNGMLIFADSKLVWEVGKDLVAQGYGYSVLSGRRPYDREEMIEMLSDWTWNGPEDARPKWLLPESHEDSTE